MRKVLFLISSLLIVGIALIVPRKSSAAAATGVFNCIWDTGSSSCVVDYGSASLACTVGYAPDDTLCKTNAAGTGCTNTAAQNCTPIKGLSTLLCTNGNLNTAIGCIPFQDTNAFVAFILKWAVGIGGGIAFILIVFSGFTIATSAGNPESLKKGQEMLTAAISGLILLIFAVVVLKIIGIDLLAIPGLT